MYAKDHDGLFALLCQTLEKLLLTIVEAKINTTTGGACLYALVVLETSGQPITGPQRLNEIRSALSELIAPLNRRSHKLNLSLPHFSRHVPRWFKYYQSNALIKIYTHSNEPYTTLELHAPDFPGLLARVGKLLLTYHLSLHAAKINTLGDKVIDFFYVTQMQTHLPFEDPDAIARLKKDILKALR